MLRFINLGPTNEMLIWKFDQEDLNVTTLGKVSTFQDQLNGSVFHPLDHHLVITYGPRFTSYKLDFDIPSQKKLSTHASCVIFLIK
jgi:hypothetical protein